MKSISYIIPHYENVEGLSRLIDSIDLKDSDEIIIVDDCSSDNIYNKISKLENEKIRVYKTPTNSGAGKARNIGMQKAKNKWLLFADSDDYYVKNYYTKIEPYLFSEDLDIIYFSPTSKIESKNNSVRGERHEYYEYLVKCYLRKPSIYENDLKYKMIVPWSKLVKRELVEINDIKFDEIAVSNDVMFAAKISKCSQRIDASDKVIYCCTENNESMTSDVSFNKTIQRIKVFTEYFHFLEKQLPKNEFKSLNLNGLSFILLGVRNNYSFFNMKQIFKILKRNNIPIITIRYILYKLKELGEK